MKYYFEVFKDILQLYEHTIEEVEFYDGHFVEMYDLMDGVPEEIELYGMEALKGEGREVLELCCGNGRITTKLAEMGLLVDGYDLSDSMLEKLHNRLRHLPKNIHKRIHCEKGDIFTADFRKEYDLVILPATTICILADDEERLIQLMNKIRACLKPSGRFIFDYRCNFGDTKYKSDMMTITKKEDNNTSLIIMQEFVNYIQGRAIANFYGQDIDNHSHMKQYISYTDKKIIVPEDVVSMLNSAGMVIERQQVIPIDNYDINFVIAKKGDSHG